MAFIAPMNPLTSLLKHARETVDECLPNDGSTKQLSTHALDGRLNEVLFAVTAAGNGSNRPLLSRDDKADIWHIVCKLWMAFSMCCLPLQNWCADVQISSVGKPLWMVAIRQYASDILELLKDDELSIDERSTKLSIYHKTGKAHAEVGEHEAAEACYARAQVQSAHLQRDPGHTDVPQLQKCDFMAACMDLLIDRLANAWALHQQVLASDLFSQAINFLRQQALTAQQQFLMCRLLILACLDRGQQCLKIGDKEALGLLNSALELFNEHMALNEDDADFEKFQREARSLQAQLLRLLSLAYLLNGQAAPALQCLQNIRKLEDPLAGSPGVLLTAIQALSQLGQHEQAEAELLALAGHEGASLALCLQALAAAAEQARTGSALQAAVEVILERFAADTTAPLRIVELLLDNKDSKEKEAIVLDIANRAQVQHMLKKGTHYFNAKDYKACREFHAAALYYADAGGKATVARQLALAHMALDDLEGSLEQLDIALEHEPSSVYTTFVKIKVLLSMGQTGKAVDLLKPLMACEGFSLDFLRMVSVEAVVAGRKPVAEQALKLLWEKTFAEEGDASAYQPGDGAVIGRNLIMLVADMADGYDLQHGRCKPCNVPPGHAKGMSDGAAPDALNSIHQQLAGLFDQAREYVKDVGAESFFGKESPAWFTSASFNAGLAAMSAQDVTAAAVLFRASGSFSEAFPAPTPQLLKDQTKAYLLATKCTLAEHSKRPNDQACLSLAQALLKSASASMEAARQLPAGEDKTRAARKQLLHLELDLVRRQRKHSQVLQLIERAKTEGILTADELLQLSYLFRESAVGHQAACKAALTAALQCLCSGEGPPAMDTLAEVVRRLYELSTKDEALGLMAYVASLVQAPETPTYPRREMSWLVSTTWNRGCRHVRLLKPSEAVRFMEAALSLMDLCEDFRDRHQEMKQELQKVKEEAERNSSAIPDGLGLGEMAA